MPPNDSFLFPPFEPENETLALKPLLIAGMVRPVVDGDGGINIAVVQEDDRGMLCVIDPYTGMQAGDKHVIYWETEPVFNKEVEPDEVDKRLFFYLPTAHITPGWVEECYYQLTRMGESTPDDPSVPLRLLTKLNKPGGRDKEPHLPDGHSELHIVQLPPELIEQGLIDAEWAKNGVPITIPFYLEMALRDTILMRWGSVTLPPHLITQAQVDGVEPIVIIADQDAILAGGDSTALELKYDIHDEVWNWAERHSKRTRIAVDAGGWRLDAPFIEEAINGTITLDDLNKQDVTVQIIVNSEDFDLGDTVKMTWIGTPFTGKPLIHTESKTIEDIPNVLEFKVPYADVRAIAMGRADASYVLTRINGDPPSSSKRAFADVVGDVSMLPEPTIQELVGDILAPDELFATVVVRYPGIANGDLVNLIWLGTQSNNQPYLHEESHTVSANEAESGFITLHVASEHISVLDNGRLDLSYRVSNDQVALYGVSESERLLVKVEAVRATLPAPIVVEADPPDLLDPSNVLDNATVRVDYPGTKKGDVLTYYWTAVSSSISTSDWIPITTLQVGKPIDFRVDARFVTPSIGQIVKVRYTLKLASTGLFSYSQTLNLQIGTAGGFATT